MLECAGITRRIGAKTILDSVDLTVETGRIVALLGPSGGGKSSLLRAVAGLDPLQAGTVRWDGEDITHRPVHTRGFGLMFQGYALFPHKTVAGNVGFGLRMDGATGPDLGVIVDHWLAAVGLEGFGDRKISGLSGGEQQRVALARTLAPHPRLVMLDEPLGALDRLLRRRLLDDIEAILRSERLTAIYVTHDLEEAETVADSIALMREGRIVQKGTLDELRSHPVDSWVAEFLSV